jgi:disulfide bond formation protein DsbB
VTSLDRARWLALLLPAALLAGAWGSELIGGLYPCEMCWWQRWPHLAAIALAIVAFTARRGAFAQLFVVLAAIAIAVSGAIGAFHAGVEYGWWPGITACTSHFQAGGDMFDQIMAAPLIRCDVAPWTLFGISLAGFNAILSLGGALTILWLALRRTRR